MPTYNILPPDQISVHDAVDYVVIKVTHLSGTRQFLTIYVHKDKIDILIKQLEDNIEK